MALKFLEHFLWIASAMLRSDAEHGMWDEEDGFFYDVLRLPDGSSQRLKVRSMVGLLPLCAVTVFEGRLVGKYPELIERFRSFLAARPELTALIHDPTQPGRGRPAARVGPRRDEAAARARQDARREGVPQPVRHPLAVALPRRTPVRIPCGRAGVLASRYLPAESDTGMFGGNSNWRGPIWMPVNALIIRALLQYLHVLRRTASRSSARRAPVTS